MLLAALCGPATAMAQAGETGLNLGQALNEAFSRSPQLQILEARLEEAAGRLIGAEMRSPFNPQVDGDLGQRRDGATTSIDWSLGLSQEVEVFNQRSDRIAVANADLIAAQERMLREKRLLAAQVQLAFGGAVRAREQVAIERMNVDLSTELFEVAGKRFAAGSTTRLDLNLASAELGKAQGRLFLAEAEYLVTRAILAETVGLQPRSRPVPLGGFSRPQETVPALEFLLRVAGERRADLRATRSAAQSARARIALARSEAVPNLTLRGFFAREGGRETIAGGGLSVAIPLFNRNQGEIAVARAAGKRTAQEQRATRLQVEREVLATYAHFEAARQSTQAFEERVVDTLEENLQLLGKSFRAGKVGLTDVLVIRRSLLESRLEYVATQAALQTAHVELLLAAGIMPAGPELNKGNDNE